MLATAFIPTNGSTINRPSIRSAPTPDSLASRFTGAAVRIVPAREHLYCEGDAATHVYQVEAGHVVIYRTMSDGRRQVVDFAYPGDVIGLGALDEHGTNAQANIKTIVRCLPISALRELAASNPKVGMRLYEAVSQELMASRELLFTVSQRTATERLASFLLALSRRNERRGGDPSEIVLPMTRSDIADFLGLTIETVSRTFSRFRAEGVIDLEQCILVTIRDMKHLEAMAGAGSCSRH
jgi:CRP/FNR family transcriptional regulator, anaerobic regulatory protein